MLDDEAFERLKEDIRQNGQRESVVYFDGMLLDGRNRHRACVELGIEVDECELEQCDDPIAYVLSINLQRRHLRTSQKAMAAARIAMLPKGSHGKSSLNLGNYTAEQAAKLFGVSVASIESARRVLREGCDELIALCEAGKSVATACNLIERCATTAEQAAIAGEGWESVLKRTAEPAKNWELFPAMQKLTDTVEGLMQQWPIDTQDAMAARLKSLADDIEAGVYIDDDLTSPTPSSYACPNCGHSECDDEGDCAKCHEPAPSDEPTKFDKQWSPSQCAVEVRSVVAKWARKCPKGETTALVGILQQLVEQVEGGNWNDC